MRIGFFGGSFDPPHLGHLSVARAAAEAFSLDPILFAPTGRQPLKAAGASASFEDRLAMVSLLCELQPTSTGLQPHFVPSSLDAPLPDGTPNFTVNTLSGLSNMISSGDSIFAIVGADAFLDLHHWRSPDKLLDLAEWVVVSRPGFSLRRLDALCLTPEQKERVHLIEHLSESANATNIRSLLKTGSTCAGLLPASVLTYIRAHHLYGT